VWLLAIAWLLTTLALASPTWSKLEQPLYRSEDALVIVLDLSRSMDAGDIKPSRLNLTKYKLIDLLKKQHEGKTALIVYAAEPYVVSPLTDDADTIIAQVPALETALIPKQGSRADFALEKASELMQQAGAPQGRILLITDGIENSSQVIDVVQDLKHRGIITSVLAVGTPDGAPIPLTEGGFLKDNSGAIVIPQLDVSSLQQLANNGGGIYQTLLSDKRDIQRLSSYFTGQGKLSDSKEKKQTSEAWKEQGPWLVLLILPLAALAFRRGWVAVLFVAVMLPPQPGYAFGWQDLWLTPDQQAANALEQQDSETAAKLFEDPRWRASALYKKGDYEQAAQAYAKFADAEAHYNRANALAKAGKPDEALKAYDEALKQQPGHEDAQFNRDLVKKLLDQQQQQQSQNGESQDQQNGDQSKQQNSQQQNSDQSEQQQNAEQENQEQQSRQAQNQQGESQEQQQQQAQQASEQSNEEPNQEQQALTQQEQSEQGEEARQRAAQQESLSEVDQETQQAVEQWLRRIPDDPGGLLRRKFIREHQKQRANPTANSEQPW
jgi:Ca-activated chloride channel family protein